MAKHEVQLTNDSKDIYWEDVDVSKGVYATSDNDQIRYVIHDKSIDRYFVQESVPTDGEPLRCSSLKTLIEKCSALTFYTIPDNRRINTTKSLTVDDLKNTDHVGFEYKYEDEIYKGFVVNVGNAVFNGVVDNDIDDRNCNDSWSGNTFESIIEFIKFALSNFKAIYRFDTRKELYQWLAED